MGIREALRGPMAARSGSNFIGSPAGEGPLENIAVFGGPCSMREEGNEAPTGFMTGRSVAAPLGLENRTIAGFFPMRENYEVATVHSGRHAIRAAAPKTFEDGSTSDLQSFALVVTDALLPASGASLTDAYAWVPSRALAEADAPQTDRERLARKIMSYAGLEPGWDCEDGRAPSTEDIENAVAFLRSLRGGVVPRPMVAGDGDVGFIWKTDSSYLEVGFCDNGQISFYGRTADGRKARGDNDFAGGGVSGELRKLLEEIAHVPRIA